MDFTYTTYEICNGSVVNASADGKVFFIKDSAVVNEELDREFASLAVEAIDISKNFKEDVTLHYVFADKEWGCPAYWSVVVRGITIAEYACGNLGIKETGLFEEVYCGDNITVKSLLGNEFFLTHRDTSERGCDVSFCFDKKKVFVENYYWTNTKFSFDILDNGTVA